MIVIGLIVAWLVIIHMQWTIGTMGRRIRQLEKAAGIASPHSDPVEDFT